MATDLHAPFPYFGGKRAVVDVVWKRLGQPKHYIEPFCGSAAMLFGAKVPASLEVVNDLNGFIANFWRCVKYQAHEVAKYSDYPVSHIDLGARHAWLMNQHSRLEDGLSDPDWPGDAKIAGWWMWGQCSWIGSGWCDWHKNGKASHVSRPGMGVQAVGQVPHAGNAGRGVQAVGQVPYMSEPGQGVLGRHMSKDGGIAYRGEFITSAGEAADIWLHRLANRLERVRITHGAWDRCLNSNYGGKETAVFLDPPYRAYESVYRTEGVADAVAQWASDNAGLRVALCGHVGDYKLDGWKCVRWKRPGLSYAGADTTDKEAIWFSPSCLVPKIRTQSVLPGFE